ncbi:hypothetical protein X739_33515 [Mesorhizobium sp. LNHC220B00]|nr:hypothetical protein [Mesorhizobium sp. LNHC220B00]ESY76883.1 hypothetical protein X739_33515 [Mesorhizobium sp. LNHC220B00]
MSRLTPEQRIRLAKALEIRAETGKGLTSEQRDGLRRSAHNLLALNAMEERRNPSKSSAEGLARIFDQAAEQRWSKDLREELGHRHMIHLADVFEGWAIDRRMTPEWTAKLIGWTESLRRLANEVGSTWDPPRPAGTLSLVGFMGRNLMDE